MAPKQAPRTNCLSSQLVPVINPSAMKTKQLTRRLFVRHWICSATVLAGPTKCRVKAENSILPPGSLSASFHQGRLPRHLLIFFFFLWFSDCVGFCQIEQTKPVEKHHKRRDTLIRVGEQMPPAQLNHLSTALIYGKNKRQLFNTEQEESALGTDKRRKMPDSFWIWT